MDNLVSHRDLGLSENRIHESKPSCFLGRYHDHRPIFHHLGHPPLQWTHDTMTNLARIPMVYGSKSEIDRNRTPTIAGWCVWYSSPSLLPCFPFPDWNISARDPPNLATQRTRHAQLGSSRSRHTEFLPPNLWTDLASKSLDSLEMERSLSRSADAGTAPSSLRNGTQFTSILCRSQLSREKQASNAAHGTREMIQVTISWGDQFQSAETNVEQSFVVQERFVGVLQLVEAQERLGRCWQFYHNK